MNLKTEFELGYIYVSFIYRSRNVYRQHLEITCKLCTSVCSEVKGISYGTLPLTLKTSLNT